jgi:hypothetical protein
MSLEDRIEQLCNEMVDDYRMPGLCYLNKHTLTELAKELPWGERVVLPEGSPYKPVQNTIKPQNAGVVYFVVDDSLADGEIIIKDTTDPEFDKQVKKRNPFIGEKRDYESINTLVHWLMDFDHPDDCKVEGQIVVTKPDGMCKVWNG